MARFDIYSNPDGGGYLLDVQADLLSDLNTRVVVPLIPLEYAPAPASRLNPVFNLRNGKHVMVTQFLSAVRTTILGDPVSNAKDHSDQITNALDMVFQGF